MKKEKNTTPSGEDYLEAILILQRQKGLVRPVDIARHMEAKHYSRHYNASARRLCRERQRRLYPTD